MQIIIFLIEVTVVFFLVDLANLESFKYKITDSQNNQYSSYYSINKRGETVLLLTKVSQSEQVEIWKSSSIKDEVLDKFPNVEAISRYIDRKIVDDNNFKKKLIGYIEYVQGKYLSGDITQDEFKDAIANPDPSLPSF